MAYQLAVRPLLARTDLAQLRRGFRNNTDDDSRWSQGRIRSRSEALSFNGSENGLGGTFDEGIKGNGFRRQRLGI